MEKVQILFSLLESADKISLTFYAYQLTGSYSH